MNRSIIVQLKIMVHKLEFIGALLITLLYACISLIYNFRLYKNYDSSLIPDADTIFCMSSFSRTWSYFEVIFPFIIVLPFAISFVNENRNGIRPLLTIRNSHSQYFISKSIACFIGGVIIIFIPFLLNLILCHIFFPHNNNVGFGEFGLPNYFRTLLGTNHGYATFYHERPFLQVYLHSTTLYNLLYIILLSLFSGIAGVFILSVSYFVKKHVIVLFLPFFLITRATSAMTSASYNEAINNSNTLFLNYSILDYFSPFSFSGQNWFYMLFVIVFLLCFCVFAHIYVIHQYSKRESS